MSKVRDKTKEISVFVDESGSFAPESVNPVSRYYLICLVAHDQDVDISDEIDEYDRVKVYYDNGQSQVLALLKEAFAIYSSKTEFVPEVAPEKYRLFQAADLACTLALVRTKLETEGRITLSEKVFFGGEKFLRKVYLKPIERKEWR